MRRALAAAAVLLVVTTARAQSAQDKADAEALFHAGKAALAAGKLSDACVKLAASQSKDPAIGTALYLGECYERSGKIASAWAQFHQAADMASERHDTRAGLAKARADRLVPSRLTVGLSPDAKAIAGLAVTRDGEHVGSALFDLAAPVDGGHHVVVATAPGRRPFEWRGDLPAQRGAVTVTVPALEAEPTTPVVAHAPAPELTVTPPSPPPTSPAPEPGGGLGSGKAVGLGLAGAGVVAVGVSIALGAVASGNYSSAITENQCNGATGACPTAAGVNAVNDAKLLADVGTGVFIGGCALAAAGVVLFFVLPRPRAHAVAVSVTPLVGAGTAGALLAGHF